MQLVFTKMHGLGNDFIVIDDRDSTLDLSPEAVEWMCDRNFGIGADGVMLVRPATTDEAHFSWWFRNSDGSVAEMCGNGIRCFAKFVCDGGLVGPEVDTVRVETSLGVYVIRVARDDAGAVLEATVDMGEPILDPVLIPTTLACDGPESPVIECGVTVDGTDAVVTCVSMGNPHCVIFVDDVDDAPVHTMGPALETHAAFPRKTNVEFARVLSDDRIELRVWERGVGETLACGTGACATVVAAHLSGRTRRSCTVELPGGELRIDWDREDGRVRMTGPATIVYDGVLAIPEHDE